jgi:hypothetical protein
MTETRDRAEEEDEAIPWKRVTTRPIGGLLQVGYAEGSDLLLVLSSQGRGVFDCLTGRRIAGDEQDAYESFDPIRLMARGFGPLEQHTIRMAGLFGGGLSVVTLDGWILTELAPAWPSRSIYLRKLGGHRMTAVGDAGVCELRAYGFSETGRSFIVATSCDLTIYAR